MENKTNKSYVKNIPSAAKEFNKVYKAKKMIRKKVNKALKRQIIHKIQKRKHNKINNELKKLRFYQLANKNNVTESDLANIKKFDV